MDSHPTLATQRTNARFRRNDPSLHYVPTGKMPDKLPFGIHRSTEPILELSHLRRLHSLACKRSSDRAIALRDPGYGAGFFPSLPCYPRFRPAVHETALTMRVAVTPRSGPYPLPKVRTYRCTVALQDLLPGCKNTECPTFPRKSTFSW